MGKNWDWSYQKGRKKRLQLEVDASMHSMPFDVRSIPMHSHCATMQSYFSKGWNSVSPVEIAKAVFSVKQQSKE